MNCNAKISTVAVDPSTLPPMTDLRRFLSDTHDRLYFPTAPTTGSVTGTARLEYIADASSGTNIPLAAFDLNCSVSVSFTQLDGPNVRIINDSVPLTWRGISRTGTAYLSYGDTAPMICLASEYVPEDSRSSNARYPFQIRNSSVTVRRGAVSAINASGQHLVWAGIVLVGLGSAGYPDSGFAATLLVRHIDTTTGLARTVLSANVSGEWLTGLGFLANPSRSDDHLWWASAGLTDMLYMTASGSGAAVGAADSVLLLPRYTAGPLGNVQPLGLRVDLASGNCTAVPLGLGTPFVSAAFDDLSPPPSTNAAGPGGASSATSSSLERSAYLLYADDAPVSSAACDPRGEDGILDSGTPLSGNNLCYPHFILRDQPQLEDLRQQFVLPFEHTQQYCRNSCYTWVPGGSIAPNGMQETSVMALNRRAATADADGAAPGPVFLYLADRARCQVRRVDPRTGASSVVTGYDGGSSSVGSGSSTGGLQRRSFLCSLKPRDGAALGPSMGRPGRISRGSPGTLFVGEDGQEPNNISPPVRIRRITGV